MPPRQTGTTVKDLGKDQIKVLFRVIGHVFSHYTIGCILVVLCIIVTSITNVIGMSFTQKLVDELIPPLLSQVKAGLQPDYGPLGLAILRMAGIYLLSISASLAQQIIMVFITQGTLKDMRNRMFKHMQKLPIRYFDTHSHGEIMSRYTNDTDTLRQLVSQSVPSMISSAATIISVVVGMMSQNVPLTAITVVMVCIMLIVTSKVTKNAAKYFIRQQKDLGAVNGYIEEMMTGQKVVKVFCHEDTTIREFCEKNDGLRDSGFKAHAYSSIVMPINAQIGNVSYVICAFVGSYMAIHGMGGVTLGVLISFIVTLGATKIVKEGMSSGQIISFLQLNKSFNMPVSQLSQQLNSIVMAIAGADRIYKLLAEEPELDEGYVKLVNAKINERGEAEESAAKTGHWAWKHYHKDSDTTTYQVMEGDVVFENVDFGYDPEKIVLHDINLHANPGEKIALVGSTGAGKTTITNLITRFYDIQKGKIRYDGINIEKIAKDDLRHSLGIVLQETHLFTGTVAENIRYGRLDATDEEVIAAAKLANAHEFIEHLPDGYNTMLTGDGANLSQGQRQLLAIARAAIEDPPVLILDEATSSIDTRTEAIVQDGMDKLMKGRTTFVIAHRLSTVRNSDRILVMEAGRIIEQGRHEELIEQKGRYYQLYTGSFAEG